MKILNLTQHLATQEQVAAGVVDAPLAAREEILAAMTFDVIPTRDDIFERAEHLANLAAMCDLSGSDSDGGIYPTQAMIGGAPFFMSALESALSAVGIEPMYAFSRRVSIEKINNDGSVTKTATFNHIGFVSCGAR